jgi:hypothetical protein
MPLRLRLAVLFAAATALVIAVAGFGFILQLRVSLDATLDTALDTRAAALTAQILSLGPTSLRLDRDEEPAQLLTPTGRILATSPDLATGAALTPQQLNTLNSGAGPVRLTTDLGGERTRLLGAATRAPGLVLVVGMGTDITDAASDHVEQAILLAGPPAVLISGIGAWLLAGAALRPVERMRRQAAQISEHDTEAHLAVPATRDEIAALATTMNHLLDRLRAALARERGFVADAGHELRTPLATLSAELELAARPGRSRDELADAIAAANHETARLIRLSEDLLMLARASGDRPFLRMADTELRDLLTAAAQAATTRGADRRITVHIDSPPGLTLPADPNRLRQVLDNLLDNATRHAPQGSTIDLTATCPCPGLATLSVRDRGTGFPRSSSSGEVSLSS